MTDAVKMTIGATAGPPPTEQEVRTAARKVIAARTELVLNPKFAYFASGAMHLQVVNDEEASPMWTDGTSIGYATKPVLDMPHAQLVSAIAKGVVHNLFCHPFRRAGRDDAIWQEACTLTVNPILAEAGLELPDDAHVDPRFPAGTAVETVFRELWDDRQQQPDPQCQGEGDGDAQGEGDGDAQGEGDGGAQGEGDGGAQGDGGGGGSPEPKSGNCEVRDATEGEGKRDESDWKMAAIESAKAAEAANAGAVAGWMKRLLQDAQTSYVDWLAEMIQFAQERNKEDTTYKRPNRRVFAASNGEIYLPSRCGESVGDVVFVLDTSGSVNDRQVALANRNLQTMKDAVQPKRLIVLCVDTRVAGVQEFGPDDDVKIDPHGGGGTRFQPAFDWVEENGITPECLIYFTDLYGPEPQEPPYPVMWLTTTFGREGFFGRTIFVKEE